FQRLVVEDAQVLQRLVQDPGGFGLNGRGVEQLLDRLDAHLAAALGGELHHGGQALVGRVLSGQDVVGVTGDLAGARADVANERGEIDTRAFEPRAHGRRPAVHGGFHPAAALTAVMAVADVGQQQAPTAQPRAAGHAGGREAVGSDAFGRHRTRRGSFGASGLAPLLPLPVRLTGRATVAGELGSTSPLVFRGTVEAQLSEADVTAGGHVTLTGIRATVPVSFGAEAAAAGTMTAERGRAYGF